MLVRLRSSIRQSSRLLIGDVQVRVLLEPSFGRAATGAVPRLENGWVSGPWGFDSLPFLRVEVWPSRQGSALLARRRETARRFESCCLRHIRVWSNGKTRGCYPRDAGSIPAARVSRALVVERNDAGPSTRKRGFDSRRGYFRGHVPGTVPVTCLKRLAVGELATPPVLGTGDRRFDSCRPDLRGRGAAVLASLMSSRPWVRIPPALLSCGRPAHARGCSSAARAVACQAKGRRFESGRPRFLGGRGVTGSTRDCESRSVGSIPAGHLVPRTASQGSSGR
jgi:hypothetical protein